MSEEEKKTELKTELFKQELNESIAITNKLISRHTDGIPNINELTENNMGKWIEHDLTNFNKMFDGLLDYCNDEEEYDNLDWNTVNYEVYGADYYSERFPGFSDDVYEILAKSTKEENKIVDNRIPPLKITEGEVTVSFS